MTHDLFIKNVRPMGGPTADVLIRDGRIDQIGPNLLPAEPEVETIDGDIRYQLADPQKFQPIPNQD